MPDHEYKGYTIEIRDDDERGNPRKDCDNLWTFACDHRRYTLGDMTPDKVPKGWPVKTTRAKTLYLYDHSGITIATTPFSCPWDSGIVGVALLPLKRAKQEFGGVTWTSKLKDGRTLEEACDSALAGEISAYDDYLVGKALYSATIVAEDGEIVQSYGGFEDEAEAIADAKQHIDSLTKL